jgi:multicomponent Na+:H+ antiporter subunit G
MSPRGVLVAALLVVGVGVTLAACVGVLVMRDAYDRLHYTAPATTIAPLAIAAAVVLEESLSAAGVKALLVALVLLVTNPVLTHATARAARVRQFGEWTVQEGEQVKGEHP